jgi:hypothetical protein
MAIFATFKYSRKALNNNYDAWITHHMCVKGFTMVRLTLSNVKAITLAMASTTLDFMVNLNKLS